MYGYDLKNYVKKCMRCPDIPLINNDFDYCKYSYPADYTYYNNSFYHNVNNKLN